MVCKITDKTCTELFIECFHVMPRWCPQLILQELNSILMQTFSFVLTGKDANLSPSLAIETTKDRLKFLAAKNTT